MAGAQHFVNGLYKVRVRYQNGDCETAEIGAADARDAKRVAVRELHAEEAQVIEVMILPSSDQGGNEHG
jgi:hypothetical protein